MKKLLLIATALGSVMLMASPAVAQRYGRGHSTFSFSIGTGNGYSPYGYSPYRSTYGSAPYGYGYGDAAPYAYSGYGSYQPYQDDRGYADESDRDGGYYSNRQDGYDRDDRDDGYYDRDDRDDRNYDRDDQRDRDDDGN